MANCYLADKEYGERLAEALKLDLKKIIELSRFSHTDRMKATSLS